MAFATVGGVDVSVSPQGSGMKWVVVGDQGAAFDGSAIGTVNAYKRVWTIQTLPMTTAAATTLRNVLHGAPPVAFTGDWPGTSTNVLPNLTDETPQGGGPIMLVFAFTLTEA